jgi:hypothetical protein
MFGFKLRSKILLLEATIRELEAQATNRDLVINDLRAVIDGKKQVITGLEVKLNDKDDQIQEMAEGLRVKNVNIQDLQDRLKYSNVGRNDLIERIEALQEQLRITADELVIAQNKGIELELANHRLSFPSTSEQASQKLHELIYDVTYDTKLTSKKLFDTLYPDGQGPVSAGTLKRLKTAGVYRGRALVKKDTALKIATDITRHFTETNGEYHARA